MVTRKAGKAGRGEGGEIGGAQSIRRALEVVRVVAQIQRSGASLSRVARTTGLTVSTAFRILRSLVEERMLRYNEEDRCYYIGPLAFEIGLAASSDTQVPANWRAAVEQVARETQLTSYLMARSDNDAVCLLCVQGSAAVRAVPVDVGQRLPLGVGAGSLAILASLSDEEITRVLSEEERRLDVFAGRAKPERIWRRVAQTRENGFSATTGTVSAGVVGVGVAIPPDGGLTLALSASAVAGKINLAEARKIASVISAAITRNATHLARSWKSA